MSPPLPRYFVARSDAGASLPVQAQAPIMQIIDSFIVGGRHLSEMDCVVGVDALGDLQLSGMAEARQLDEILQGQLTYNEVSANSGRRMLLLSRFYLFALQLLEQVADAPGLNDPIYLYGKLYGAFPDLPGSVMLEGQLTITRADFLHGMVESAPYAFNYAAGSHHSSLPTRCLHFLAPADMDSELARGAGAVIVYPLPTAELAAADPSNEAAVKQMLFEVLNSFKKDLVKNKLRSSFARLDLPVPSRRNLELDLESRGYVVKGNSALRKIQLAGPFDGILESIYGKVCGDKLDLPPEGSIDDFIGLAKLALQNINGWPTERSKILSRIYRRASAEEIARASQSVPALIPRLIKTPRAPEFGSLQSSEQKNALQESELADADRRAKDFMGKNGVKKTAGKPDWLSDFNDPPQKKIKHNKTKADENESKPDWMGDFQ
ncbi:MAG: hypothetical protein K2X27_16275 [Candidatus Obscuribacterales bacterium]|nr:hypothetical protein [Candidatus Obscuribacterales bacterium]